VTYKTTIQFADGVPAMTVTSDNTALWDGLVKSMSLNTKYATFESDNGRTNVAIQMSKVVSILCEKLP
jgi:hypothetical protein